MNIPSGNITFLFTDIEGSTMLAQDFPDTLPVALQKHHSILSLSIESNNGFLFKTTGDAFCCSFEKAVDALNAALEIQRKLTAEKWTGAVIKVRMGIHSGVAEWSGTDYTGYITLAATERIMSAASGGQILISNDTYSLIKEIFHETISFRDLGERRLKNVIQPIRLFQIVSPSLRDDFPPLKTLDARPNNLPVQLTSFIGREEEMKHLKILLRETHLLTLTGSGGSGKTRLALQVAADVIDDFANGVWFVELASLLEPALLPQAIMKVFGLKEEPKRSLENTLCDYLKDKEMLIILDNCEHLVEQCAKIAEKLLSNSPKLKIIATSRETLRSSGEQTHRVLSLAIPDPQQDMSPEKLSQYEAVRLFIERALSVDSTFRVTNSNAPALAQICYQLDGIPLAIELAAARIKILSVEKIYERLNDRFNLLTGGKRTALPRQQTLKATVDWSYDLLSEKEKILLGRLSVFTGGWTLEAAEEVCSDKLLKRVEVLELLSNLSEKSIIIFEDENERYRMLETIRQYGEEKHLGKKESAIIRTKHLKYFMKFAETAEPKLLGAEQKEWLDLLELEQGNLQAALVCSIERTNREEGFRLAGALGRFWNVHGYYSAGRWWMERLLELNPRVSKFVRAKILHWVSTLAIKQGDYELSVTLLKKSLTLKRKLEDKQGIADSLIGLGNVALCQGEGERAKQLYQESLAIRHEIGDKHGIADSLNRLGVAEFNQGNYEQSWKLIEECVAIQREIGNKHGIAHSLFRLGRVAYARREYGLSRELFEDGLAIDRELGDKGGIAASLLGLGELARIRREYELAKKLIEESVAIQREIGNKLGIAFSLLNLGRVAYSQREYELALEHFEDGLAIFRETGDKYGIAASLQNLGDVALIHREHERAWKLIEESVAIQREIGGDKHGIALSFLRLGRVAKSRREHGLALKLFEDSLTIFREVGDKDCIAASLQNLGDVAFNQGKSEWAREFYDESLIMFRETEDKFGIATCLNNLGDVALNQGEYELAKKFYVESLTLKLKLGDKNGIAESLIGFAGILRAGNHLSRAVMLLGASESVLKSISRVLEMNEQKFQEQIINKLHEKLSDEEFSKYFEEGKKLTLEQAMELALSS